MRPVNDIGLSAVVERHDNTRLSWFKRWLRDVYTVRIDPSSMTSRSEWEVPHPKMNLSDFACWYRHLMQERPAEISELFGSLSQVLDGFRALELLQDGEVARTLKVRFETLVQEGVMQRQLKRALHDALYAAGVAEGERRAHERGTLLDAGLPLLREAG